MRSPTFAIALCFPIALFRFCFAFAVVQSWLYFGPENFLRIFPDSYWPLGRCFTLSWPIIVSASSKIVSGLGSIDTLGLSPSENSFAIFLIFDPSFSLTFDVARPIIAFPSLKIASGSASNVTPFLPLFWLMMFEVDMPASSLLFFPFRSDIRWIPFVVSLIDLIKASLSVSPFLAFSSNLPASSVIGVDRTSSK